MSTLADKIETAELPVPVQGEALVDYARRVAYIGGLIGEQHALVHRPPVTIYLPPPPEPTPVLAERVTAAAKAAEERSANDLPFD